MKDHHTVTIDRLELIRLMNDHHDVLVMVDKRTSFHLRTQDTPRGLLTRYLDTCLKHNLILFGDAFLAHARNIVSELEAKTAANWRRIALSKVKPKPASAVEA